MLHSRLSISSTPDDHTTVSQPISRHASAPRPEKRRKMTITQTYFLAHTARGKLSSEAARGDHDLRLLVGHANLLDALTLDLQDAEREQDAWFEKTVAETRKASEPKRVQWTDQIAAQIEQREDLEIPDASDDEDNSDAASDDGSDVYDEPAVAMSVAVRRRAALPTLMDLDEDAEKVYDDEESDNGDLQLVRTTSHSAQPPELIPDHSDSSDDEDEEVSPVSPAGPSFTLPQDVKTKDFAAIHQSSLYSLPPTAQQILSY